MKTLFIWKVSRTVRADILCNRYRNTSRRSLAPAPRPANKMSCDFLQTKCDSCAEIAYEPYIECCECDTNLCTACFASGKEIKLHKNDHKYAVRRNDFPLFENCNWSAKEECKLLAALSTYGYGNWEEISKNVHTRSKLECQEHYKKYYLDNVQYKELELVPETDQSMFPKPITPYLYNMDVSTNPPRNNQSDPHLAGYNAYRSEFELSYDNNAESILNVDTNNSDDEPDECMDALKVSLVNALNTRLRERQRRYQIIQNHGLIMPNKLVSWLQTFDHTLTRPKVERLVSFMQFMSGMQFDAFVLRLSLEAELHQKIIRLCEHRKHGIRTLYGAQLYKRLKREHDIMLKEQKQSMAVMMKRYDQSPIKNSKMCHKRFKRTSLPLDITDLPDFNLLSDSEKHLCSNLRLLPANYMEIKDQLVSENNKIGFLRLLDARRIVKIDVNKTRKIYDYLVTEGIIRKPEQIKNSKVCHRFKHTSLPLDITDLPGFHLLSDSERHLCSNLPLLPVDYVEVKDQLVSEYNKIGFLTLLDARRIAKIDVNKTRKVYDYLVTEGFIRKPEGYSLNSDQC